MSYTILYQHLLEDRWRFSQSWWQWVKSKLTGRYFYTIRGLWTSPVFDEAGYFIYVLAFKIKLPGPKASRYFLIRQLTERKNK
jgi:hypothetical protein